MDMKIAATGSFTSLGIGAPGHASLLKPPGGEAGMEEPVFRGDEISISSGHRAPRPGPTSPIFSEMPCRGQEESAAPLQQSAGEKGKPATPGDEIQQKVVDCMADPVTFTRELNITRLVNLGKDTEGLSKETKRWFQRKMWKNDLRKGKMPDLTHYPDDGTGPSRVFLKGYCETILKPPTTPEKIYEKLLQEEKASTAWFVQLVREEMQKGCRQGASTMEKVNWNIRRNQDKEISGLVEKYADDREVMEKMMERYEKKLKRAFKLAKAIVRPDNIALEMARPETREELSSDPHLYSHITRPRSGVIRKSTDHYRDLARDIFRTAGYDQVPATARGDYYPKFASLVFKSLPPGIDAEQPYPGPSGRFLPSQYYTVDYDRIAGRALYYTGDAGMSFWDSFTRSFESSQYEQKPEKFSPEDAVITERIKPLKDLSNLFEFVMRELVDHGNIIRMPGPEKAKETIEVMIMGQMRYQEDFR